MKFCSTFRVGMLCASVALAAAGSARAQDVQPPDQGGGVGGVLQPFRGLFGGNERNPNAKQTLDFAASVFGGYDSNVGAAVTGQPSITEGGSPYWRTSATLTYMHDGPRWDIGTSLAGDGNWYRDYPEMDGIGGTFGLGATYAWSTRTTLTLGQTVEYSPYYSYGLFAAVSPPGLGGLPPFAPGLTVVNVDTLRLDARASFTHLLSPRAGVVLQYGFNYTDFQTDLWTDVTSNYVGGRYLYAINDYFGLRAGYAFNRGQYGGPLRNSVYQNHIIDAGVDYSRALRLSRRTTFSFSTGSTIVTDAVPGDERDNQVWFGVLGNAGLRYSFLRSWSTGVAYSRKVTYNPGLTAPVYADSVSADLTGYFADRLRWNSGAAYSHGTVGVGREVENTYSTTSAYTSLQYALSEKLAAEVRYFYYYYDFSNRAYLPIGVAQTLRRNGVEAGLTVWLPVLAK